MNLFTDISYTDQKHKKLLSRGVSFKTVLGSHEHGKGCPGHHQKITICEEEDRSWSFLSWLPGPSFQESPEVRVEIDLRTPSANLKSPHGREGSLYCEMFQKHMFFFGLGHTPKNIRVRCQRLNLEGAATLPSAGSHGYMTRTHYTDHNII